MSAINSNTTLSLSSDASITVNGKTYAGSSVIVANGRVYVDRSEVDGVLDQPIKIEIDGDVEQLTTQSGDVNVNGDVSSVSTMSGDVKASRIYGQVETMSGDIYGTGL